MRIFAILGIIITTTISISTIAYSNEVEDNYVIRLALFQNPRNINLYAKDMKKLGYNSIVEPYKSRQDGLMFRISLGPFPIKLNAKEILEKKQIVNDAYIEKYTQNKTKPSPENNFQQQEQVQKYISSIEEIDQSSYESLYGFVNYFTSACNRSPTAKDLGIFIASDNFYDLLNVIENSKEDEEYYRTLSNINCQIFN